MSRRSVVAVVTWAVLTGIALALDGAVGGFTMVLVAAVRLAGWSPRLLGGIGAAALAAVPVAVLVQGLPTAATVSPSFVVRSLVAHHLAFAGVVLVVAGAVLDLVPRLEGWAAAPPPEPGGEPPLGVALGGAVTLVVAVGALVACTLVVGG